MTDKTELEVTQEPCMACGGDGQDGTAYVGQFPCHACGGTGVVKQSLTTEPLSKTEQFDLDELKLWADDECPEGVSGIPDQVRELITFARHRLATRTPDPTPVAKVRVKHGGYGMELATYVAYGLPEGDHWLYAHPPAVPADGLVEALTEIERRTGLLIHQNVGRWSAKVEHDLRTMNVLSVNQSIARTALAAYRGEA